MIKKMPATDPDKMTVRFELPAATWAESAHLVGDFDGWNETMHPLERDRLDDIWHFTLELGKGNDYEFRYLVNGHEWHNDWKADRYGPNPHGGSNSVVSTTALLSEERSNEDTAQTALPKVDASDELQVV